MTQALWTQGVGLGDVIVFAPDDLHSVRHDGSEPTMSLPLSGLHPIDADRSAFAPERRTAFRDQISPLAYAMGASPPPHRCSSGAPGGGRTGWGDSNASITPTLALPHRR